MAKGFKHGAGGGTSLNFKVVGGTSAPSNPKANTIWVNTDKEITSWQFASDDPNLLDFNNWANNIPVTNGTKSVSGNAITFVANTNDCYTDFSSGIAQIPCVAGKTYILEWEHSGATGEVYCFPSGGLDNLVMVSAESGKLEYTPSDGVTFFTFRFGVRTANTTATYSNIRITEKDRAFAQGAVWFSAGTSSTAPFNALKKNGIMVYPIRANQYVNGAWVGKTAKTYQKGTWVEWATSLYKAGGVNTAGWSVYDPSLSDHTLTFGTYMVLTIPDTTGTGRRTTFHTDVLDLTNAKTLSITMKNTNNVTIGVASAYSTSTTWITSRGASAQSDFTTHTFDVSAINSGMVALRFEVNAYKTGLTATFESVYLT